MSNTMWLVWIIGIFASYSVVAGVVMGLLATQSQFKGEDNQGLVIGCGMLWPAFLVMAVLIWFGLIGRAIGRRIAGRGEETPD